MNYKKKFKRCFSKPCFLRIFISRNSIQGPAILSSYTILKYNNNLITSGFNHFTHIKKTNPAVFSYKFMFFHFFKMYVKHLKCSRHTGIFFNSDSRAFEFCRNVNAWKLVYCCCAGLLRQPSFSFLHLRWYDHRWDCPRLVFHQTRILCRMCSILCRLVRLL